MFSSLPRFFSQNHFNLKNVKSFYLNYSLKWSCSYFSLSNCGENKYKTNTLIIPNSIIQFGSNKNFYSTYHQLYDKSENAFKFSYPHLENKSLIPSLPLPDIHSTLEKYLFYQRPLLSDKEFEITNNNVNIFIKSGDAKQLQEDLIRLNQESNTSWLEGLWDSMYLDLRCPLPINVSPFILLKANQVEGDLQIGITSDLAHAVAKYQFMIQNNILPQDKVGKQPLDMSQYRNLFSTSRIPFQGRDKLMKYTNSRHVLIISNGNYYTLPVISKDGKLYSRKQIYEQLASIKASSFNSLNQQSELSIGTLTLEDRDIWASIRNKLSKTNESIFDAIDSSLAIFVLDKNNYQSKDDFARSVFHGSEDRWYDKTQFIISKNGMSGINMEHTGYDGHTLMTFIHYYKNIHGSNNDLIKLTNIIDSKENFSKLDWNISAEFKPKLLESIATAKTKADSIASFIDCSQLKFNHFGSNRMKECQVSPDAFVQMSYQLAFYRSFGKFVSTYESANTKYFYHGRTETVRSCSVPAKNFVQKFDSNLSSQEKINLFREACNQHVETLKLCQQGQGVDRHLFALKNLARKRQILFPGYEIPAIFTDENYINFGSNILSTSNVSTPDMEVFGFGPVHAQGFGIGYSIQSQDIVFYITNYENKSQILSDAIEKALLDLSSLFNS